jgi:hypothetical protein
MISVEKKTYRNSYSIQFNNHSLHRKFSGIDEGYVVEKAHTRYEIAPKIVAAKPKGPQLRMIGKVWVCLA